MSTDERSLVDELSGAMHRAGFNSTNARVQSAMSDVFGDSLKCILNMEELHVFGSFSEGWGSCLSQLDGSIEEGSDIDITVITDVKPTHLCDESMSASDCASEHTCARLADGHVQFRTQVTMPNFSIDSSGVHGLTCAFDIILALPCCGYPPVAVLQPDYRNRVGQPSCMPEPIMKLLRDQVFGDSPKCHAVSASPPGEEGGYLRVSTTFLERVVLRNLSTVQGQFFIIVKFLIKRVISKEVSGLKTYMAKNLLFYMLDETAAEEWKPENLVELTRRALKMLLSMIELLNPKESEDVLVCMKHFFLRDANVYFKKIKTDKNLSNPPKPQRRDIVAAVRMTVQNLSAELKNFKSQLSEFEVTTVSFYAFHAFLLVSEIFLASLQNTDFMSIISMHKAVVSAYKTIAENRSHSSASNCLPFLLNKVAEIPDKVQVTRECLRAMAYRRAGVPVTSLNDKFGFAISREIDCSAISGEISHEDAKAKVLKVLEETDPFRIQLHDGKIVSCNMKKECEGLASCMASIRRGEVIRSEQLLQSVMLVSPLVPLLFSYNRVEEPRARQALTRLTRQFRALLAGSEQNSTGDTFAGSIESADHLELIGMLVEEEIDADDNETADAISKTDETQTTPSGLTEDDID